MNKYKITMISGKEYTITGIEQGIMHGLMIQNNILDTDEGAIIATKHIESIEVVE